MKLRGNISDVAPADSLSWADVLGRLLSDRDLRESFCRNAGAALEPFALQLADKAVLVALKPEHLRRQAQLLVEKRRSEVRRFLPVLFARLGTEAETLFAEHATTCWPEGHRRHLLDAAHFLRFVRRRHPFVLDGVESARVTFLADSKRVMSLSFFARCSGGVDGGPGVQLLVRSRGRIRQWRLFLAWPRLPRRSPAFDLSRV